MATLRELDESYLMCRYYRAHQWTSPTLFRYEGWIIAYDVCARCDMEREIVMTGMGVRVGHPKYIAPEGYGIEGGVDAQDVRKETIRRLDVVREAPPHEHPYIRKFKQQAAVKGSRGRKKR